MVPPARRRWLLNQLNRQAQIDLSVLWETAKDNDDFAATILEAYPAVVDPYHQLAGQLAAGWFEDAEPNSNYIATVVAPLAVDKLVGSAEWALRGDGDDGLARLSGSLQRSVFDGARDTTIINARDTRTRWAVVAVDQCCDFCQMLASRGAVYVSQDTAEAAIQGFHDNCKCVAVEERI